MKKHLLSLLAFLVVVSAIAQNPAQTIRGKITDVDSKVPLIGAAVVVYKDTLLIKGATADESGYYRVEDVPVGRYTLIATYVGYEKVVIPNVVLNSGKELIQNFEMEESVTTMEEVTVTANKRGEALNEMVSVSARGFSVEETDRYAGSRGDPARMASNFAGVQGNDDSKNDIVVRGNSPFGVLYRLEGVNIPSPNHFSVAGSTGGPVGILNNKVLANSDFMTGAFPAEFGNSIAAAFDLKMRNGNDEKHEFTGQLGFFGTELTAEGPLSKKSRSSYMVNYRYATITLFSALGIDIGTESQPKYQDMAFKLNFPNSKGDNFSVFGIGGISNIDLITSNLDSLPERELYGDLDKDEHFRSGMGVAGMSYTKLLKNNAYIKLTLAGATEYTANNLDKVHRDSTFKVDSLTPHTGYIFSQHRVSANLFYNKKFNSRHTLKTGIYAENFFFDFIDTIIVDSTNTFLRRMDYQSNSLFIQPFAQWNWKINPNWTFNAGVHGQYFTLNNSWAIEPRAGIKWKFHPTQSLSAGFGMHSQLQPTYVYFQRQYDSMGNFTLANTDLDFNKSIHYVLGYDNTLNDYLRMKIETYYQRIYNVPVDTFPSNFYVLNEGSGFDRFFPGKLVNEGTGENYGIEFTLEKFFHRGYFFMFTGSVFNATFRGSRGVTLNSDFNSNYVINALGTKEFKWGKKNNSSFGLGGKITYAGGRRFTPIDTTASALAGEAVYVDSERNKKRFRDYFRADIKLNYKINAKKITHEVGVDLVNLFGIENVLRIRYVDSDPPAVIEEYQLGFLPAFYYKIDF